MKKVISLITALLLIACLSVSATADTTWASNFILTSTIRTLDNPHPYCHGPVIFTARSLETNNIVSLSCKIYNACLVESEITNNCLSKSKCAVDYGYCTNGNYNYNNNGNGSNGENGNNSNGNNNNNGNNNPPYSPPQEKPKKPELKHIELTAYADKEHIQINTNIRASESLISEGYTSTIDGKTQTFNVNLQSITNAEFEEFETRLYSLFWTSAKRQVSFNLVNNNDYPVRISWDSNSVKIADTSLPLYVISWTVPSFFSSREWFVEYIKDPRKYGNSITESEWISDYTKLLMPIGEELYSYNGAFSNYVNRQNYITGEKTNGYIVIPPHESLKNGTSGPSMGIYFIVPEKVNSSANVTIDFMVTRDS